MKVSTVFSAFAKTMSRKVIMASQPDLHIWNEDKVNRQRNTFEYWLCHHIPAMEKELDQKSRWLCNLDTARGGYSYQQMNLKERKAYLETRRENRRHLRRIRVLEAELELPRKPRANLAESLGRLSAENERLREVNIEMHRAEKILGEIATTLHIFMQARPQVFLAGEEIDKAMVEYATRLETELAAYKSFFTTPGDVWGNRDRWLKGQQK